MAVAPHVLAQAGAWQAFTDGVDFLTETLTGRVILYLILVAFTWVLARVMARIVLGRFAQLRHVEQAVAQLMDRLFVFGSIVVAMFAYAGVLFGINVAATITTLGLVTLAIGFGLQNTVANVAGGISLAVDRPFRIGDQVQIGEILGEVERIGIRSTRLVTLRQEYVVIPNKFLEEQPITNYTMVFPELRLDVPVGISYGSDRRLAEKIMREVAVAHPMVLRSPTPQVLLREFGDFSVDLELRCWIARPRNRFIIRSDLLKAIKDRFDDEGVEIPFPYRTLVNKSDLPAPATLPAAEAARDARHAKEQPRVLIVWAGQPASGSRRGALELVKELDAHTIGLYCTAKTDPEAIDFGNQVLNAAEQRFDARGHWFKPILRAGMDPAIAVADVEREEDVDLVMVAPVRRLGVDWSLRQAGPITEHHLRSAGVRAPTWEVPRSEAEAQASVEAVRKAVAAYKRRRAAVRSPSIEVSRPEPTPRAKALDAAAERAEDGGDREGT